MAKPTTHVLLVTDMSGSMAPLADDVRGGFNRYVEDLRQDKDAKYRVTAVRFDTEYMPLCMAAKLADVPTLDRVNYAPRGATALLDAVGRTITEFETRVPDLAEGDRVLLVVQTDGHENSSREFTRDQIAELVKRREAGGTWTCLFLGAGIDAWDQAQHMGFQRGQTISTVASAAGTQASYGAVSRATRAYAAGADAGTVSGIVADEAGEK